ncbi:MAG: hypothetical protein WBG86_03070 [Polyangiales bacterium]
MVGALWITGCAGTLDNPDDFIGGAGGSGSGPTVQEVFLDSCGTSVCHDADAPASGLDLVSPNVEARTVEVNSTVPSCSSEVLVIVGDPDESYLMKKIMNAPGICGGQMPIGTILDEADTQVIRDWILDLGGVVPGIDEGPDNEV